MLKPKLNCCRDDQKQEKNKNIIFFGGDVTICICSHSPLCYFLSLILGTPSPPPPPPYTGDVIFAWPFNTLVGVDAMGGKTVPLLFFPK